MPTESQENAQIAQRAQTFIDALHALEQGGDEHAQDVADLFATDATLTNAALQLRGQEANGQSEVLRFWQEYRSTLGTVESKFHHITTNERAAGLFWTTQGRNPNGEDVHYHGCTLLEFDDDGQIAFFRGYYDTRELQLKAV